MGSDKVIDIYNNNGRLTADDYVQLYGSVPDPWNLGRRRQYYTELWTDKLLPKIPTKVNSLIDLGSGMGAFLVGFLNSVGGSPSKPDYNPDSLGIGIEYCPQPVDYCRMKLAPSYPTMSVYQGSMTDPITFDDKLELRVSKGIDIISSIDALYVVDNLNKRYEALKYWKSKVNAKYLIIGESNSSWGLEKYAVNTGFKLIERVLVHLPKDLGWEGCFRISIAERCD